MKPAIKIILAIVLIGEMIYWAPNGKTYYINESPTLRYVHPMNDGCNRGGCRQEPDVFIDREMGNVRTYIMGQERDVGRDYPLFEPSDGGVDNE